MRQMQRSPEINKKIIIAVLLSATVVLDQASKLVLMRLVEPFGSVEVVPGFFSIVNVSNPGAAFGMLKGHGSLLLVLIAVAALILIAYLLYISTDLATVFALSLIAGGALGNLIDMIRFAEVVDFLDFYIAGHHWPAFNVADIAITCGVIIYLTTIYKCSEKTADKGG